MGEIRQNLNHHMLVFGFICWFSRRISLSFLFLFETLIFSKTVTEFQFNVSIFWISQTNQLRPFRDVRMWSPSLQGIPGEGRPFPVQFTADPQSLAIPPAWKRFHANFYFELSVGDNFFSVRSIIVTNATKNENNFDLFGANKAEKWFGLII